MTKEDYKYIGYSLLAVLLLPLFICATLVLALISIPGTVQEYFSTRKAKVTGGNNDTRRN